MRMIVLLINVMFTLFMLNRYDISHTLLNEADSASDICAVSIETCDYAFNYKNMDYGYRIGDDRELHVGNKINGVEFDGEKGHRYIDGSWYPMREATFEEYDAKAAEILDIAQQVIRQKLYTPYNDDNTTYDDVLYYFRISEDGLKLFPDHTYTYGLIVCVYYDKEFHEFDVTLHEDVNKRATLTYTFGTIDYKIFYSDGGPIYTYDISRE